MTTFDRFNIKVVAGVGLCGAAIALSPDAAAAPLKTGGYACVQAAAGEVAAPAVEAPAEVAAVAEAPEVVAEAAVDAPVAEVEAEPVAEAVAEVTPAPEEPAS